MVEIRLEKRKEAAIREPITPNQPRLDRLPPRAWSFLKKAGSIRAKNSSVKIFRLWKISSGLPRIFAPRKAKRAIKGTRHSSEK